MAAVSASNGRGELLERLGRFYGDEHLAIAFTAASQGDDAKRVTTRGWDKTRPLADGDFGASYLAGRAGAANPVVVLRPSNLIVLECDTEQDLVAVQDMLLPTTITVRSSAEYKRHWWFRPPAELEAVPYVAFRFESGKITADAGRYFLVPPSVHPSGAVYSFLPGLGPGDVDIAELPEDVYRELSKAARADDSELRERIQLDPEAKIQAGKRREMIFRYACMLRRWGVSYDEIVRSCEEFNRERCHPPVEHYFVRLQVDGAMKKEGGQEIDQALAAEPPFELTPISAPDLCDEPDLTAGQLLGPLMLAGGRTIVVGDTGAGKTTVSMQIIRAILAGDDFLGWEGSGEGRALIIDLEQGRRSVRRSLRDAQLDTVQEVDLVLVPDGLSLDSDEDHFTELERVIAEGGYTIVLLDPYYKAHRADEPNAERPIVDLMRKLDSLRTNYGFCLLLPAHPRKPAPGSPLVRMLSIHDIAGSGAVTRGAEIVLGIERVGHGRGRLRFLKDREGDLEVGEAWQLLFNKEEGFRRDPNDGIERDYQQILTDLLEDGEWRSVLELKDSSQNLEGGGVGDRKIRETLKVMLAQEDVETMKAPPGRSSQMIGYRLTSAPAASGHQEALEVPLDEETATAPLPQPLLRGSGGRGTSDTDDIELP